MRKTKQILSAGVAILFLVCISAASAQQDTSTPQDSVRILYTGRLFGYFRIPDHQPRDVQVGTDGDVCNAQDQTNWSPAAHDFHERRQTKPDAILVGTGDNFAPEIEAREFALPEGNSKSADGFIPRGKDQYVWYPSVPQQHPWDGRWVHVGEALRDRDFRRSRMHGEGSIPTDNVGCFLIQEKYAAVVPGRHDFYFGPERLRELAGFLAEGSNGYVRMLGANLVIATTWKDDHKPLPDTERKWNYAPHWPQHFRSEEKPQSQQPETPRDSGSEKELPFPQLVTPGDGRKVYPWLPGAVVKLMDLKATSKLYGKLYQYDEENWQDNQRSLSCSTIFRFRSFRISAADRSSRNPLG